MKQDHNLCGAPNFKWFGLALQALVILSKHNGPYPSCQIADCVKSEATLIRRVLAQLAAGGILQTREGRDGGYVLTRDADTITLAEVYQALEAKESSWSGMLEVTGNHAFGMEMKDVFSRIVGELNDSVLGVLEKYTIKDLIR